MSRIGKKPISVPPGVTIRLDPSTRTVAVEGPRGNLACVHRPEVQVTWDEGERHILCTIPPARMKLGQMRAYWGTVRSIIQNMVTGVTDGYAKKLEIVGVGWGAQIEGRSLRLNIGFCHPVDLEPPASVAMEVKGNVVTISGPDKQAVGQFAAEVRAVRPPEPYNGKGIRYADEYVMRKQGKIFGS